METVTETRMETRMKTMKTKHKRNLIHKDEDQLSGQIIPSKLLELQL